MSPTPQEVIESVFAAGPAEPAFIWAVIGVVAAVLTAGMGVVSIVDMISRLSSVPTGAQDDSPTNFGGPRSQYGDAIPFIFGTVQVRSPICLWHGGLELSNPFPWIDPADRPQYASTIDLLLCERVLVDGAQHGSIRLRKIWAGTNLLWNGSHFAFDNAPVTASGNLLAMDPSVDDSLVPGGGFVGSDGMDHAGDNGWWFGGIVAENRKVTYPSSNPSFVPEDWHGNVLGGDEKVANSGVWARYLGMEKIRFYAGSGAETQDPLGFYIFGPSWNTAPEFIYPSYHKFSRLVFERFYWGPEPQIPDISAEVTVTCPAVEIGDVTGIMTNGLDVNPISVLYTLLTRSDFSGGLKLPGVDTTSFSEARQIAHDEGLGMSYRLQSPTKARELVDTILKHVDGFLFLDPESGLIKVKLARLVQTQLSKFNESHVLSIDDISKTTWEATFSQARVTFEMRGGSGNQMGAKNIAVAKDPGLAANSGLIETIDETLATVYDPIVANTIAARLLSAANTPLFKVQLRMSRAVSTAGPSTSAMGLRPGDMFILDYAPLGLTSLRLRVVKVDLGSLESNAVQITTIQDIYQAQAIIAPPGQPDNYTIVDPPAEAEIETYAVITAPYLIAKAGLSGDARMQLTTSVVPKFKDGEADLGDAPRASNYDRFFVLARKPYDEATALQWSLRYSSAFGGAHLLTKSVPYTPCALVDDAQSVEDGDPINIKDMDPEVTSAIRTTLDQARDGSGVVYIGGKWFVVAGFTVDPEDETKGQLDLAYPTLDTEVHQGGTLVLTGDTPIFFCNLASDEWMQARLGPPLESNNVWFRRYESIVGDEIYAGQSPYHVYYQEPFGVAFSIYQRFTYSLQNIDPTKVNAPISADVALEDRANALLPPLRFQMRQCDPADGTPLDFTRDTPVITVSTGETEFAIEFSPITGDTDEYAIFNPRESDGTTIEPRVQVGERAANLVADFAERVPEQAAVDGPERRARLEVWYKFAPIDPEGDTLKRAEVSLSNKRLFTFQCAASGSTSAVDIYVRQCLGGDRGEADDSIDCAVRLSVPRSVQLLFSRI